ncbi:M23 family metallopeptidase, partial [bacterium]
MGKEDSLELSVKQELENPSRRRFLRNSSEALLGLVTIGGVLDPDYEKHLAQIVSMINPAGCVPAVPNLLSDPKYKDYIVDLNQVLRNELKEKRDAPHLLTGKNPPRRADWDQHLSRPGNDIGGLDFAPVEYPTEIVPAASGYTYRIVDQDPRGSGMTIAVFHPFGYLTHYAHLHDRYVERQTKVELNNIIAVMGNSGEGAKGITHLHLT